MAATIWRSLWNFASVVPHGSLKNPPVGGVHRVVGGVAGSEAPPLPACAGTASSVTLNASAPISARNFDLTPTPLDDTHVPQEAASLHAAPAHPRDDRSRE